MLRHARITLLAALAQATPIPPKIGGSLDAHDCLISAGYSWCDATESCVRVWETPCPDRFDGCGDCLAKQRQGINIACPMECDVPEVKRLPIDYLLTGLASTNDYPVYQVPEPDTVYLPIPAPTPA